VKAQDYGDFVVVPGTADRSTSGERFIQLMYGSQMDSTGSMANGG
jgi:hypothetical protein